MDATVSEENRRSEILVNYSLVVGVLFLLSGGLFLIIELCPYKLPYIFGTLGFLIITVIGIRQIFFDEKPLTDYNQSNIGSKWQELMVRESEMLNELETHVQKLDRNIISQNKVNVPVTVASFKDARLILSNNNQQLIKNQITINSMSELARKVQVSKDRLLLKQVEYLLKLDELERRLIIDENGIKLV